MTTLPETLQDVLAAMREASPQCAAFADRLEAAQSLQAPEGWVLVPVVPTEEMWTAYFRAIGDPHSQWHTLPDRFRFAYTAMLESSPTAALQAGEVK